MRPTLLRGKNSHSPSSSLFSLERGYAFFAAGEISGGADSRRIPKNINVVNRKAGKLTMVRNKRVKVARNKRANVEYDDFLQLLNSHSDVAQSFETLLSSLNLLDPTRPLKTILVTSTQPEEGKTTVATNLAMTLTLAKKKVLILDADLRRPTIHQIFRLENTRGLADILTENRDIQEAVQLVKLANRTSADEQTLSVVTSGKFPCDSFKMIEPPEFEKAIERCKSQYDMVLLDSSPVLSVSDPLLLAPIVDGVILVLNTGVVTEHDAKRAKERLEQAGGRVLGIVMNRFDEKRHGPGFHPYHAYYGRETT